MTKAVEAIMMFTLFLCVFFAGVSYSDAIKSRAGWLFETSEVEVDLPKNLGEGIEKMSRDDFKSDIVN